MAKKDFSKVFDKFNTNVEDVREEIVEKNEKQFRNSLVWKPTDEHQVRFLPYPHNDNNSPFTQVFFHWNIGQDSAYLVCPKRTGISEDCPICELTSTLYKSKEAHNKELGKQIMAKSRWYAPVIIRGEEEKGVKFFGFGKKVMEQIVTTLKNPDYNDAFHPLEGVDWTVTFKEAKSDNEYGSTTVSAGRKARPIIPIPKNASEEDIEKIYEYIIKFLEEIPNIFTDVFVPKNYDELADVVFKYVQGESSEDEETETEDYADEVEDDDKKSKSGKNNSSSKKEESKDDEPESDDKDEDEDSSESDDSEDDSKDSSESDDSEDDSKDSSESDGDEESNVDALLSKFGQLGKKK